MSLKVIWFSGAALGALVGSAVGASAQTMLDTLSLAYSNNPTINADRSRTRATDESVAIAKSGFRPQISGSASEVLRRTQTIIAPQNTGTIKNPPITDTNTIRTTTIQLNLVQPIFTGFQTVNQVKQSESAVRAQRENTRNTEQTILLDAATAFMDVIRDTSVAALRETDVRFYSEQVRAARDRFNVGEGTRTDVAQAEARQQLAISQLNAARANLAASRATYRQVVGIEPKRLTGSYPVEKLLPRALPVAIDQSQNEHPAIMAGIHNIDVATWNVKVIEGELLPSLNLQGSVSRTWMPSPSALRTDNAQIGLNLTVPIYQGGAEYARIRQAKEDLGTARIQVDATRDQVRQAVVANWGQLESANASIIAAKAQVAAAQLALSGVIEEQRVGQRTTLDVLNAQTDLTNAQIILVTAERNKVVAAYALAASIGRLDSDHLRLQAVKYHPEEHYEAVKDKWFGLRTPDGR